MRDPLLTPYGENQCRNLNENFPFHAKVEMIVASPLRRTLYTAILGFETVLREKDLKVVALPEIQETSDVQCDTGSELHDLENEIKRKYLPVELGLVMEGWHVKVSSKFKK